MSQSQYYANQSLEDALRTKSIHAADWDSMTAVFPYESPFQRPAPEGGGRVPPSSYFESPEARIMAEPLGKVYRRETTGVSDSTALYLAGAALIVLFLYNRR